MRPYQVALIRYLPDLASGEFVNIGALMWITDTNEIIFEIDDRYGRISGFFKEFDGQVYSGVIHHLNQSFQLAKKSLKIAKANDNNKVFLKLLDSFMSHESACFQWSAPMGGINQDPATRFRQIIAEMIEKNQPKPERARIDDHKVLKHVKDEFRQHGLLSKLKKDIPLKTNTLKHVFPLGWRNTVDQYIEPLSLDYQHPGDIEVKATSLYGKLYNLSQIHEYKVFPIIAAPPEKHQSEIEDAISLLESFPAVREVVRQDRVYQIIPLIEEDLQLIH